MTDDLRKLANAATPGPWRISGFEIWANGRSRVIMGGDDSSLAHVGERSLEENEADAAYIVAACNALPALLDRIETLEKALMEIARPTRDNGVGYARQIDRAALRQGGEQ